MSDCPDGRCDGSGFLYDEARRRAYACSCRPTRIARRRAKAVLGRIPRAFREVSFEREPVPSIERANPYVVRAVRHFAREISDNLAEGRGLWFTGDVGTGKTTLAMLISKAAMEREHTVAIYSLPRLLSLLRETFRDDSPFSLSDLVDRLCAVDLLHIDDIGAEQTTPWVLEQLYTVINTRYEDRRSLLLTTNLVKKDKDLTPAERERVAAAEPDEQQREHPAAALRVQIGKRTVSRIYEMCGEPLPLWGEDRRMDAEFKLPVATPAARPHDPFDDLAWEEDSPRYGQPRRLD